jgi:hypothetical protein
MRPFLITLVLMLSASNLLVSQRLIHVFVALCDNENQGIVKVPKGIGNGQDPGTNLYWGCGYGVKTVFTKDKSWKKLSVQLPKDGKILDRILFKHTTEDVYLLAEAYDGREMEACVKAMLDAASGNLLVNIEADGKKLAFGGNSDLICFTGHNGLMDFNPTWQFKSGSSKKRETIILACYSKSYFKPYIAQCGASPLIWSTGLMAPEAYILQAAFRSWVAKESNEKVRESAAAAYSKYQKCSLGAAKKLLVTGN